MYIHICVYDKESILFEDSHPDVRTSQLRMVDFGYARKAISLSRKTSDISEAISLISLESMRADRKVRAAATALELKSNRLKKTTILK